MAALFSQRNENKVMEEEQLALVLEDPADHGDLREWLTLRYELFTSSSLSIFLICVSQHSFHIFL